MISSVLAMSLLAAAPASESREAYARCIKDFVKTSLEQKMEPAAFDTALVAACRDKEAPFKAALISADLAMGMKRAASEKSTAEQIADYLAMAKEDYRASLTSSTTP